MLVRFRAIPLDNIMSMLNVSKIEFTESPNNRADCQVKSSSFQNETWLASLSNGLKIIVRQDSSAPILSAQAWCCSGSIHEGKWMGSGLSHVLEHMLFKGTKRRKVGQIDREVQDLGGHMNAYTSLDRTVYWINVPKEGARIIVDILCDIMRNATLPADELEKEREVIRREMDMCDDDPGQSSIRCLFETAYSISPYRHPVIGYPDVFCQLKRDDILDYYREKYAASNCFFVIVGDVDPKRLIDQIAETDPTASRPLPPFVLPTEPRQTAPRECIQESPIELGHFHFAWHIPSIRHPDLPALDVLGTLLGEGRSSRLFHKVREQMGLVHSVDAWTYNPGEAGLFGISGVANGDQCASAGEAILAEIERAKAEDFSEEELEKAKKIFLAGTLSMKKTMQGQAQDLGGSWMAASDIAFSMHHLDRVRELNVKEMGRVAREYLIESNRTMAALLPKGTRSKAMNHVEISRPKPIALKRLNNGLRVLTKEDHRLPFVELRAVFRAGVLTENVECNGQTRLMAKWLLKGAGERNASEIVRVIESVGGHLSTYGASNSFGIRLEILKEDLNLGLDILSDLILRPAFSAEELERERQVHLAALRAQEDQILQVAFRTMREALFGNEGYGLDALGTSQSVSNLRSEGLIDFFKQWRNPANCVIAAFGDMKAATLHSDLERLLGKSRWTASGEVSFPKFHPQKTPKSSRLFRQVDKKQAVIIVAAQGTTMASKDVYALDLLQEACSDLGSRLFVRIRDQLGLAYYVGARNVPGILPGFFAFYAGTAPETAERVDAEITDQIALLCQSGLTQNELARAKAKVLGQKKIARQDLGGMAFVSALDELYGLGFRRWEEEEAEYESVRLEEVQAIAHKYFEPHRLVHILVGPEALDNFSQKESCPTD